MNQRLLPSRAVRSRDDAGVRAAGVARSLLGIAALGFGLTSAPSVNALDDLLITLKNGQQIDGHILQTAGSVVTIRRSIGGLQQVRLADIDEIRIDTAEGLIAGQLLSWSEGVHDVATGGRVVRVRDGDILEAAAAPTTPAVEEREPPEAPRDTVINIEEAVIVGPPTITLNDGRRIVGDIVEANQSTITIRRTTGGIEMILRRDVDNMVLASEGGENPQGRLIDWGEGVYKLQVGSKVVVAYRGATRSDGSQVGGPLVPTDAEVVSHLPEDGEQLRETDAQESGGPNPQIEGEQITRTLAETKTAKIEAPQAPQSYATESGLLKIEVLSDPVREDASELTFHLQLSRPAQQTIVVLYATVDGTAEADQDYEPEQGAVTFQAGERTAEVRAGVIDDDLAEGDEHFQLFLSTDPKVVQPSSKEFVAIIMDND